MMDQMPDHVLEGLRTGVHAPIQKDRPIQDQAAGTVYRNQLNGGEIGLPVENLLASLVGAGQHVKLGRGKVSTAKSTRLYSFMRVEELFLPLRIVGEDGTIHADREVKWVIDKRRGVASDGKTAVCIVRSKRMEWGFTCTVRYDEKRANEATIRRLFDESGGSQGLASFRSSRKGPFGSYRVAKWELLEA